MKTNSRKTKIDMKWINEQLQIRKDEGKKIDPATAELWCVYGFCMDPYGLYGKLPSKYLVYGKMRFARNPGSNIWVEFADIPEPIVTILCARDV